MVPQETLPPDRKDELLTILADTKRRAILISLQELPGDVATVETLADELTTRDHGGDEAVEVALVHSDLPKLDAAGILDFDKQDMTVRYQAVPEVEQLLGYIADL